VNSYVIDGSAFSTLDEFAKHFSMRVLSGTYEWHGNFDVFNDILRGGFGTPEGGFRLIWSQSSVSRSKLGPTTFDMLVSIIRDHGPGGSEAEDNVVLELM
jgi:hypothetical protein